MIFLIPIYLLIALWEYYLAKKVEALYSRGINQHYDFELGAFALYPFWRKPNHKLKRISLPHLTYVILITLLLVSIALWGPNVLFDFIIGFVLIPSSHIVGNLIRDLYYYKYILANPGCLKGKAIVSRFNLLFKLPGMLIPLLFFALLLNNLTLWGGLCGLVFYGARTGFIVNKAFKTN